MAVRSAERVEKVLKPGAGRSIFGLGELSMKRILHIAILGLAAVSFTTGCAFLFGDGALGGTGDLTDEDAVDLVASEVAYNTGGSTAVAFEITDRTAATSVGVVEIAGLAPQQELIEDGSSSGGGARASFERTYRYTFNYLDTQGNPAKALEADQIVVTGSASGTSERPRGSGSFQSEIDLNVTDINEDTNDWTATINGTVDRDKSGTVTRVRTGEQVDYSGTSKVQWTDVVVDGSAARDNEFPESGTMEVEADYTVTGDNGTRSWSGTVTITFNGSDTATARVNGSTYTIDLENGTVVESS
jgi:hypothetical protein